MCLNVCVFFIHISSHITVNVHCCKHKQVNMVSSAFLSIFKQFLQLLLIIMSNVNEMLQILGVLSKTGRTQHDMRAEFLLICLLIEPSNKMSIKF